MSGVVVVGRRRRRRREMVKGGGSVGCTGIERAGSDSDGEGRENE